MMCHLNEGTCTSDWVSELHKRNIISLALQDVSTVFENILSHGSLGTWQGWTLHERAAWAKGQIFHMNSMSLTWNDCCKVSFCVRLWLPFAVALWQRDRSGWRCSPGNSVSLSASRKSLKIPPRNMEHILNMQVHNTSWNQNGHIKSAESWYIYAPQVQEILLSQVHI